MIHRGSLARFGAIESIMRFRAIERGVDERYNRRMKNRTKLEGALEAARALIETEAATLTRLSKAPDMEPFKRALERIAAISGKLFFIGLGKSGLIAAKIASTFSSIGINAVFLHAADALHGDLGAIGSEDASILISKSGQTREALEVASFLRREGADYISITNDPDSPLARMAAVDLSMMVEREGSPVELAPMASGIATLAIGDALAAAMIELRSIGAESFARFHPGGSIGWLLSARVVDILSVDSNPIVTESETVRGAIVKLAEARLGAVSVVDGSGRLVGIVTDGDLKRFMLDRPEENLERPVGDFMTRDPVTIAPDQSASAALDLMESRALAISVLVVLDPDRAPIGILRLHDILGRAR